MSKKHLGLALLAGLGSLTHAEIDWTPHINTVFTEGTSVSSVYFLDGADKYALNLDGETTVEDAQGSAKLTFKKPTSAVFKIRPPLAKVALPVPADKVADYRKLALAYAPSDVAEFSNIEELADIYQINHWKSYRVLFTYGHYGQRIRHSITFLTLESGQQVILDLSAYEKDFPEALIRAEHLIRTWYELELTSVKKPVSN